jgi:hypothetical protein
MTVVSSFAVACKPDSDCFSPLRWNAKAECLGLQDDAVTICLSKADSNATDVTFFCGFSPAHVPYVFGGTKGSTPESGEFAIVDATGRRFGAPLTKAELATCQEALALWAGGLTPCTELTDAGGAANVTPDSSVKMP